MNRAREAGWKNVLSASEEVLMELLFIIISIITIIDVLKKKKQKKKLNNSIFHNENEKCSLRSW